jgi:glucose/arabinose dehydrogenase
MTSRVRLVLLILALAASARTATAATLPAGFTETFVSGLSNPTAMAIAPDGRIFVCQQGGALRVIENGVLLSTPFVSLTVNDDGERGLLGIAFDPLFDSNHWVYVYYTATDGGTHNRVSRFTANGNVAAPGETQILNLEPLGATNHNGGAIHFGPDGKLYVAVGENANSSNAQTLSNRLGKILRINKDGSIPEDNPFYGTAVGVNRSIWALGLRNPFTFAFNPADPGQMAINDVGASSFEEINAGAAGANYGWPTEEGIPDPPNPAFVSPIYAYGRDQGTTISGGAFYSPAVQQFPADYAGDYFFADFGAGWIRRLDVATSQVSPFASGISNPVDVHVTPDGSLYYLARSNGRVYRVQYTNSPQLTPPVLNASTNGLTLSLSWSAPAGATSYRLEGGSSSGAANLLNVDVGNTTRLEAPVAAGTYFARVRAVGAGAVSAPSNEVRVVLAGPGICATPPPAPTGYTAQTAGLNFLLAWNPSPSATTYILEAGSVSGAANLVQSNVGLITSLAATAAPGLYYSRVRAANTCGISAPSAEVPVNLSCSTTPPGGLTVTPAGTIVTFRWTAAPAATSYRALVGSAPGASDLLNVDLGATTTVSLNTAGVAPGRYYVRIVGNTGCGVTGASNEVSVTVP